MSAEEKTPISCGMGVIIDYFLMLILNAIIDWLDLLTYQSNQGRF